MVGAPADETADGSAVGSAYVFVRSGSTWTEEQKLFAPDASEDDRFGVSVAISGDTLVVGTGRGEGAYVFVRAGTAWTQQQKVVSPNGTGGWFGYKVALDGDRLLVSEPVHGNSYVFLRAGTTWSLEQQLPVPNSSAVALSGDTLAVEESSLGSSSVHVFVRSGTTWTEQQILVNTDGLGDFGDPLSLSGDSIAIGGQEFVYVFTRTAGTWTEQQRLAFVVQGDGFGESLALVGEMLVVGAPRGGAPSPPGPGAVYVFTRSAGTWIQQQEIPTPGPTVWAFGTVALSGDTLAVGAPYSSLPDAPSAGSVEVYQIEQADVSISVSSGQATAVPGEPVSYAIGLGNSGPTLATEVTVTDVVPPILLQPSWTCTASAGSSCAPGGSGNLTDSASVLVGGSVTYTLTATIDPDATGTLTYSAMVSTLPGVDDDASNDTATDTLPLTPEGDLQVTTTDDSAIAIPGGQVAYTVTVANAGPSSLAGARVQNPVPAGIQASAWTCIPSAGSDCGANGSGGIDDAVTLRPDGIASYTFWGTVAASATGSLLELARAAPPAAASDPDPSNNSGSDVDLLLAGVSPAGELIHGYRGSHVLAPSPDPTDLFRIRQRRHASYEVLLDAASGDLGSSGGPLLDRVASDATTTIQGSSPAGAGGARSLRWINALDAPVADEFVRVRSDGCTTDCGPGDSYRIGALETTGFVARFNNSSSQVTVLILQNPGGDPIDVDVRLWGADGSDLGGPPMGSLAPRESLVLDTSGIAPGTSGSITVAHTGRYGELAGKAVALEPATGFAFDTPLVERPR